MDAAKYKALVPEHSHLEGDELWDAMTEYVFNKQNPESGRMPPSWKTHTLRWLFYRKIPNMVMGKASTDKYVSPDRCSKCKWGVNARMGFLMTAEDGTKKYTSYCPHCGEEYIKEPNKNFTHVAWKCWKGISSAFWWLMDALHVVRSSIHSRFDMFSDESYLVKRFSVNMKTGKTKIYLRKRKWWEYIIIEKPFHKY